MPHLALRDAHNASAASAQAPAEVNFFLMGKESAVESARCTPVFSANHQSRPCGPQHVGDVVILPFIVFNVGKDASAAVRITIDVKETSRRARIFKPVALLKRKDLRLAGRHVLMAVHVFQQRFEPSLRHFHVGVQQEEELSVSLLERLVVAFGKTVVFRKAYLFYVWKFA